MTHSDHRNYFQLTRRSRLEKSVNSLLGIVEGIAADTRINSREIAFLDAWLENHRAVQGTHPFNELTGVVNRAIADGFLSGDEHQDLLWLCDQLRSADFFDVVTADMQRLHAMLGGIAADGIINESELTQLSDWLEEHDHLKTRWPYEEVDSLITAVLKDRRIDADEHKMLLDHFKEFTAVLDERTVKNPLVARPPTLVGLCAVNPEIRFRGTTFCFTGASCRYTREVFYALVQELGGEVSASVKSDLDYLIIGAEGNPCWAYACYGRKVEKAVELRKQGARLLLVHELDFHDAVADVR